MNKSCKKAFRQRFKSAISIVERYQLSKKYYNRLTRVKINTKLIFKHCEERDSAKAFIDARFNNWLMALCIHVSIKITLFISLALTIHANITFTEI